MKDKLRVLVLTQIFPNKEQPSLGIFVKERIKKVAKFCDLKIVAPVPWFPPLRTFKRWYGFSQIPRYEIIEGLEVFHPRFFLIPKIGRCFYGILYFLSVFSHIFRLHREFDFDLMDVHWAYPDGFAGILVGKLLRKSTLVTARGTDINLYPKFRLIRSQIIYTLQNADRIISVCQALKDRIIQLGIPESKVVVIPNGVNIRKFEPIPKAEARKQLGLPLDRTFILSVGGLIHRKGFHHIIDAISIIRKKEKKDVCLIIVGEGEYREKLERQIDRLGLSSFVKLVGAKPHDEVYKWYSMANIFCLASSREGWPNVLLEALACGLPVVATNVWGSPEVICSNEYGILVDKQDGRLLAEAITQGLEKDWDREKLVEYAKENSWDKCANKVFHEFKKVLNHEHSFNK